MFSFRRMSRSPTSMSAPGRPKRRNGRSEKGNGSAGNRGHTMSAAGSQGQTQRAKQDHRSARELTTHVTDRDRLLQQHEEGDRGDPQEVHHAADEQKSHQDPAAAKAVGAEPEAHAD